ncbi:sensor histidine kinase [Cellulomonas sp. Y8]|uniref:sensor histidine kinase n=1 Tax=Cellulomonas sp. Y8 TaxID=2591145 RepID=UPI00143D0002|nr:sensor histidine kinase [Cellulomonas sp. Y8]
MHSRPARASFRDVARSTVRLGSGGRPTTGQLALTLAWLGGMFWTTSVRTGEWDAPDTRLLVSIVGAWAPLLLRTYRPVLALLGTLVAESMILIFLTVPDPIAQMHSGMGAYQPAPLATTLAVATLASRVPRRVGWTAGLVGGTWLAVIGVTMNTGDTLLTDLLVFYLVVTAAAAGVWRTGRRERALRIEAENAERTQTAVLDERLRIARELHDALAHNLTLVNAQAGVARYLLRTDVDAAERALGDIAQHTGRAIDELRATIGLLRRRDDQEAREADDDPNRSLRPVPGLAALDELVAGLASAGAHVSVSESGTPVPLAQHVDLAAYRIVQESLTNATKHAPGQRVELTIAWTAAGVRLRITNPTDPERAPGPGTRHGLIGMRERAGTAGGAFRAGPTASGDFEVVATLPAARRPVDA